MSLLSFIAFGLRQKCAATQDYHTGAFSSEVDTGSREENASNKNPEHGTLPPGLASNHEKPMRSVAAELFDQTKFPIEIGLHRGGRDLGALIGPPVTVRGIGFWQD